jgi:hypothetical protein
MVSKTLRFIAVGMVVAASAVMTAAVAEADPPSSQSTQSALSPGVAPPINHCEDGGGNVCLYYSGDGDSARDPVSVSAVPVFDSSYTFWDRYVSSTGWNDAVRNETAYLYNNNPDASVDEYVDPNYSGPGDLFECDGIGPVGGLDGNPGGYWYGELDHTWNNNASQNTGDCI